MAKQTWSGVLKAPDRAFQLSCQMLVASAGTNRAQHRRQMVCRRPNRLHRMLTVWSRVSARRARVDVADHPRPDHPLLEYRGGVPAAVMLLHWLTRLDCAWQSELQFLRSLLQLSTVCATQ